MAIAGGDSHSLGLKSDGTVWARGYTALVSWETARPPRDIPPSQVGLTGWVAIAGGDPHSLGLKVDGTLWTWGYNDYGQLGDGTITDRFTPVSGRATGWVAIAAGGSTILALRRTARAGLGDITALVSWEMALLPPRVTPVPVSGLTGWVAIAGGISHSLGLKADGTLFAWGSNHSRPVWRWHYYHYRLTPVPVSGWTCWGGHCSRGKPQPWAKGQRHALGLGI